MKYIKEFRDPVFVKNMIEKIKAMGKKKITIMEVCGSHTMAIFKNGIREILPSNINLISGPGCPVCVTSQGYIDTAIDLSKRKDTIITTFGDMLRVPGNESTLQKEKALGRDIRMVYSPLDSLKIANENPDKEVVFLAIGFETTAPTIALSVKKAFETNIKNYSILQSIKTMPNTMRALVLDEKLKVDGFLCPGHVSTVIGVKPYEFLAKEHSLPAVVAGFEPSDIIMAIYNILEMIESKNIEVKNEYTRLVKYDGNEKSLELINNIFDIEDSVWKGLGNIPQTGLRLKEKYKDFDVENKLGINMLEDKPIKGCICGEILKGRKKPTQCKLFSKTCNPMNPVGACMVSDEGTCAAYYKYSREKEGI